ncbi:MAG: TonB-dependent receptor [Methylophilaceae bacterium]
MVFCNKCIGFLIISLSVPCFSQAADNLQLELITITGHYDNAVGTSDAASQGTVTASLIQNRPTLRPGELLEFVPGMIVSQHSGDGKANQYYLRGFNLDHGTDFATFVDDIPLNMRTNAHGQGYTDLNFLIPELVNRIDYKKGPYFADEGDFSSAGAAHIRLANQLPQGIASLSLGNRGYQRGVLADSFNLADGTLLYGLEINRNDGPWENAEKVKKYSGVLRYSSGDSNAGYNLTAMVYRNYWDATDQIPLRTVQSGQIGRFGSLDSSDGGVASRYSLSYAMHQRNKYGKFDFNAYAVQSRLDLYSNFTFFLNNPVDGDQFNQSERRLLGGFNLGQTWFTTLAGMDMQNKIGLQVRYDDLSPVALYNTVARQRISLVRKDSVKEASAGIYAENTMQWQQKFRTVAGLRYDAYSFDVASSIAGNSGSAHDGIFSPKISLIFGPWVKTEFFINYGKGFHSNDARGTTQTQLPSGGAATPVTPLVSTHGGEIGLRTEIVPGLQSSLAFWQLNIASELVFVGDAGETEASRSSKRQGVEWNNHYIANDWLLFDFDYAASHARYSENDAAGNYIPGAIDRVASFGASVNNLGKWSAAFQLRHFGPRPLIEDNSVRSKSTTVAYARVAYKFNQKANLALDIFNLFNSQASDIDYYYNSRLNGEAATGVADTHFHPVEPISARLTFSYKF